MTHVGRVLDASDSRQFRGFGAGGTAVTHRTLWPATEKQLSFLAKLQEERLVDEKLATDIAWELEQPSGPGKSGVSELITALLAAPKKDTPVKFAQDTRGALPDVPAGRYAVVSQRDGQLKFLRVDRPTDGPWKGRTFVKIQAGDEFHNLKGEWPRKALDAILAAGPEAASKRYGIELGQCGVCGRTLTDVHSRELGIGPICAAKNGWGA